MSTMSLIVASTPEQSLVYNNLVYLSSRDHARLAAAAAANSNNQSHVLMQHKATKWIWTAEPHANITDGHVGLSSVHRQGVEASVKDSIDLVPFSDAQTPDYALLRITVDFAGQRRVETNISSKELGRAIRNTLDQQILSAKQPVALDFHGIALRVVIGEGESSMAQDDGDDECKSDSDNNDDGSMSSFAPIARLCTQGRMQSTTLLVLTVEPARQKWLKLAPDDESSLAATEQPLLNPNFQFENMGIGGLDTQFSAIFRRAFASRLYDPEDVANLGIKHCKGMLLYGPPGTGKTLIARQIGKMLAVKEPKLVNGPELFNKFVGASEENVRKLFLEAEQDHLTNGAKAQLHIIIIDECEALFKARGSGGDGGTGVGDNVVTSFLAKLDGVHELPNIMVIAMTNRKDAIDPAILRPGRLELHVEIALPNEHGRRQILDIHLRALRQSGKLDEDSFAVVPEVVQAAEERPGIDFDDDDDTKPRKKKRASRVALSTAWLARETKNYSGAELEGVIRAAVSFALSATIAEAEQTKGKLPSSEALRRASGNIRVSYQHFFQALQDVRPAFGVDDAQIGKLIHGDDLPLGTLWKDLLQTCNSVVQQLHEPSTGSVIKLLLSGERGVGKSRLAAVCARNSGAPLIKLVTPDLLAGKTEAGKCAAITRAFDDASKSSASVLVLDSIERLIEYVHVGARYQPAVLQTLLVCLQRPPAPGKRLLVIATTSRSDELVDLDVAASFDIHQRVPLLFTRTMRRIMQERLPAELLQQKSNDDNTSPLELFCAVCSEITSAISTRRFLNTLDLALRQHRRTFSTKATTQSKDERVAFAECLRACFVSTAV